MKLRTRIIGAVLAVLVLCSCLPGKRVVAAAAPVPQAIITETAYKLRNPDPNLSWDIAVDVVRSTVSLDQASAAAFPALNAALNNYYNKPTATAESVYNDRLSEYLETSLEFGTPEFYFLVDKEHSYIVRADQDVFSIGFYGHMYAGGAHGFNSFGGVCFDAKDGHQIHLSELITDDNLLHKVLEQELRYEYPERQGYWEGNQLTEKLSHYMIHGDAWDNTGLEYKDMKGPYTWVITPDGVCFYFNEYSIGSYIEGCYKVLLPFSQYSGLFTGKYGKAAGDWVENIVEYAPVEYGKNGRTVHQDIDIEADRLTKSLVSRNGKLYLYVFCENADRSATFVYDLNGNKPVRIATLNDGNAHLAYDAEKPVVRSDGMTFYHSGGQTVRYAFSNPQQLIFTRSAGLGSYRVGANGKPIRQ